MKFQSFEGLVAYLEGKPFVTSDFPFDFATRVFRTGRKIFTIMYWEADPIRISLKSDPVEALIFRQLYPSVTPGYHLNKKHWNSVVCDSSVPDEELRYMIDMSYDLVLAGLSRRERQALTEGQNILGVNAWN